MLLVSPEGSAGRTEASDEVRESTVRAWDCRKAPGVLELESGEGTPKLWRSCGFVEARRTTFAARCLFTKQIVTAIRWALIALEIAIGTVFTGIGFFQGVWAAEERDAKRSVDARWVGAVLAFTACWPTAITLLIGRLGPRPHGNVLLTALAGFAGVILGWGVMGLSEVVFKKPPKLMGLVAALTPSICTVLVFNFSWLFPNTRLPAIDFV
jgi:hypothetical protein